MNITPELAAKVLAADLHNIVKKVSDGGILSSSERAMLQNAAFPESQQKTKRALVLALKYSSGARLTAGELAEVRELHPGFAPEALTVEPTDAGSSAPPLALTPEPSPTLGDGVVTRAQIERWTAMYGREWRQIRRWIKTGREKNEPCPLDDPEKMPAWVDKHVEKKRQDLIDSVAAAAAKARQARESSSPAATPAQTVTAGAAGNVVAGDVGPRGESFDLSTVGGVEGQSVEFFRRLFAGLKEQLEKAYLSGDEAQKNKLLRDLERIGESLRKHEAAAEAKAARMGEYIERAEVTNDVMEALNILMQMREKRAERIRAELADVPADIVERVIAAHDAQSRREEDLLLNLSALKTPADVSLKLAA